MEPRFATRRFLKLDETEVGKFTITDHIPVRGKDEILSYPKAGDPNPKVAIGMAAASNLNSPQWIDLAKYGDQILISNVDWQPDGQRLIFQLQNREQTFLDLISADKQGNYNVLFRDKTDAWIESPGNPKWLSDDRFVWPSPRNGYKHLYLYDDKGTLLKQLTAGEWEVRSIQAFDSENKVVYFSAAKDRAHQMQVFRLDIESGNLQQISTGRGTHRAVFNESATHFIDTVSTVTTLPEHRLFKSDGTFLRSLQVRSDDRWEYYQQSEPEFFEIASGNDQPLDAMLIKPVNFDPVKKVPGFDSLLRGTSSPSGPRSLAWQLGTLASGVSQRGLREFSFVTTNRPVIAVPKMPGQFTETWAATS